MKANRLILLLLLFLVAADFPSQVVIKTHDHHQISVTVEVADTLKSREVGLMYRRSLAEDHGMLFLFPQPVQDSFWMKNTFIPLDLLFIDSQGQVVDLIEQATPLSEKLLTPSHPYTSVLEVKGGFVKKFQVQAGDQIILRGDRGNRH